MGVRVLKTGDHGHTCCNLYAMRCPELAAALASPALMYPEPRMTSKDTGAFSVREWSPPSTSKDDPRLSGPPFPTD